MTITKITIVRKLRYAEITRTYESNNGPLDVDDVLFAEAALANNESRSLQEVCAEIIQRKKALGKM